MRTWAPKGPILEFNFNRKVLSAMAGMTFWNFYFQLFPRSIRSPLVIEFLGHLKRRLRRPVLVIWDRLSAHTSRMTRKWIEEQQGLDSDGVSPGLCAGTEPGGIPVGGTGGSMSSRTSAPRDWWELDDRARRALKRITLA